MNITRWLVGTLAVCVGGVAAGATIGSLLTRDWVSREAAANATWNPQDPSTNKGARTQQPDDPPAPLPCEPVVVIPSQGTHTDEKASNQGTSAPVCPGGAVISVQTLVELHLNTEARQERYQ